MTFTNSTDGVRSDTKTLFINLLNKLPDKTKKWIFLSSVLAVLRNVNDPNLISDSSLVQKLEEIFSITATPRACIFAMRIKHLIWKSTESKIVLNNKEINISELHNKKLSDNEINDVVEYIKNLIPAWIKYSNEEDMNNDVRLLVQQMVSI